MKRFFITYIDSINVGAFAALAFTIPFGRRYLIFFLWITVFLWLLNLILNKNSHKWKNILSIGPLLIILYYILSFILNLFAHNYYAGYFDLEMKLAMLVLPLIIFTQHLVTSLYNKVLMFFTVGTIFTGAVCFILALFHSFSFVNGDILFNAAVVDKSYNFLDSITQGGNFFFYTDFSYFLHPSYFAMYSLLSLSIVLFTDIFEGIVTKASASLFLIVVIFLCASKVNLAILFFLCFYFLVRIVFYLIKGGWRYCIVAIAALVISVLFAANPRINIILKSNVTIKPVTVDRATDNSLNSRLVAWQASYKLISDNCIFGIGAGDVRDELAMEYEKMGFPYLHDKKLNSHNQYLESFLGLGIFGFFILVLLLSFLAFKTVSHFGPIVALIFALNFLFESMLNTFAGLVAFVFIYCILVYKRNANDSILTPIY